MATSVSSDRALVESFVTDAIIEGSATEAGDRREVWVDLIREGFGNPRDNHYYGRALLEDSAPKFVGAKMYANHLSPEAQEALRGLPRDIQDVMGRILETKLAENGAGARTIRARVNILQDWLWNMVKRDPGVLGVSINARGSSRPGTAEQREAKIVEAIQKVNSVDWVTEAGAGGEVIAFVEAQVQQQEQEAKELQVAEGDDKTEQPPSPPAGGQSTGGQVGSTSPQPSGGQGVPAGGPPAPETDKPGTDHVQPDPDDEDEGTDDSSEEESTEAEWEPVTDTDDEVIEDDVDVEALDPLDEGLWQTGDLEHPSYAANRGRVDPHAKMEVTAVAGYQTLVNAIEAGEATVPMLDEVLEAALEAGEDAGDFEELRVEFTEAVNAAADEAYERAKAEFDAAVERIEGAHVTQVAQVEARYEAARLINADRELPAPSKRALLAQFHDFLPEPVITEGQELSALQALEAAVNDAISAKKTELGAFTEARVSGAGDSADTITEADRDRARGAGSAGATRRTATLDSEIDGELGIPAETA